MEERIKSLEEEILELKTQLAAERARSKIYKELIVSNTNIKFREAIRKPQTPSVADEDIIIESERTQPVIDEKPAPPPAPAPKPIHAPAPAPTPAPEVASIDTSVYEEINEIFERMKSVKTIGNKTMTELQKKREILMTLIGIEKTKEICKDHIAKLTTILVEKGFSDKKIDGQIAKSLTGLEMRFIKHPGYFNSHLDVDDQQKLMKSLESRQETIEMSSPFHQIDVSKSLMNYGSILINIKTNLQRVLGSCKNIIYVENPKSTKSDPFSFYTLGSVEDGGKLNWIMDCRLEELTLAIRNDVFPYLVGTFRELYFDVFGDNLYRKDYKAKCYLTECDCQQLLTNIYAISSNNILNNLLKTIVRETSTITPDPSRDKFNISSDDAMQKKRWKTFCATNDSIVRDLFDEISNEDALEFENIFTNK